MRDDSSMTDGERLFTFVTAAVVIFLCFAASALPVPLIAVWGKTLGLTTAEISGTVFSYIGGCFLVLIAFARLSNAWGRKWTAFAALVFDIASCFFFIGASTAAHLIAGRFLQGLGCGFAASAAMSWAIDSAPRHHRWLGPAMSTSGPLFGFTVGTLLAGFGIQYGWVTENSLFEGLIALLLLALVLVYFAQETVTGERAKLLTVLKPSFGLAPAARSVFPLAVTGFIGTWALTCFFQGFSARVAGDVFNHGVPDALFASVTYLLLVVPNALGGLALGRFPPQKLFLPLIGLFVLTGNGIFFFAACNAPVVCFIAAIVLCGFSQGGITTLSLKMLVAHTEVSNRAQTISSLYVAGYLGTGIPVLVVALGGAHASMMNIAWGFLLWFGATAFLAVVFSKTLGRKDDFT